MLRKILEPFAVGGDRDNDEASVNTDILNADSTRREVTKADFYSDQLSGGESSASRRAALCRLLGLPDNMSANALLAAVNLLCDYDTYRELVDRIE